QCLEKGTSHEDLKAENVISLLVLSTIYQTTWLFDDCKAFIFNNIDDNKDQIFDLLKEVVIPYQISGIMTECMHFLYENINSLNEGNIQEMKEIALVNGLVDLSILCNEDLLPFCKFYISSRKVIVALGQDQLEDCNIKNSLKQISKIKPNDWHPTSIK